MSLERRTPFALLHPNAKPTDAAGPATTAHVTISRPRRQLPAYHYHLQQNPHKRYATVLPGSSRSSATSSAESLYSSASSMPRRRKLSAAEDVAARVRARWAALEALERASGAPSTADAIAVSAAAAAITATGGRAKAGARMDSHVLDGRNHSAAEPQEPGELEKGKENAAAASASMQVDSYVYEKEKPLPPRPAALLLHLNADGALAGMPGATTTTTAMVPMAVDTREEDTGRRNGPAQMSPLDAAGESGPATDSTLRTTPTSLTCFETTESMRPAALQRRPTRALTPPQVRRRPSITDELEEAVRFPPFLSPSTSTVHICESDIYM